MTEPSPAPRARLPLPSLGPRGEGWVILQVVLIVAAAAAGIWGMSWAPGGALWRQLAGWVVGVLGLALLVAAAFTLGRQLTPLPHPVEWGHLHDRGAYAVARHPMYGGALLILIGWALATSPLALVPAALGFPFLEAKRRMEEAWLVQHHPAYADYQRRVRWRLIPFVW